MDADALLHPRGPLPPGVYWRRRLVTLAVTVLVLFGLTRACGGDGGADSLAPAPGASTGAPRPTGPQATNRPTAAPTTAPTTAATIGPCADTAVTVSARADAQTYSAARRPVLTIGIANRSSVPCTRDVGQAAREIRVLSGNDRVWSSDDCSPGGGSQVVTLNPGAAPVTFSVTWSRRRSAAGCPAGAEEADAGTYRVVGRFGQVVSTGDTFVLAG